MLVTQSCDFPSSIANSGMNAFGGAACCFVVVGEANVGFATLSLESGCF